jgi:ABC-2 type transport system ATP-binding protein
VQPDDLTIILHRGKVLNQGPAREIIASAAPASLNDAFRRITEGKAA